jgi:hypothetical protein
MKILRKFYFLWLVLVLMCLPPGCATNKPTAKSPDDVTISRGRLSDGTKWHWYEYAALPFILAILLVADTSDDDCDYE